MAKTTESENGLTISYETGEISAIEILADIGLHAGTPIEETEWLNGNAGGSYPGSLTGFTAQNTDGNAAGSMRMVTLSFTMVGATAEVFVFTAGVSKIIGVVGTTFATADKTLSVATTETGLDASPPAKTGGALSAVELHAEAAGAGTVTLLLLN